ncbi:MAG: hypothetical protein ACREHE_12020 [Rhizomicrobium sp.]
MNRRITRHHNRSSTGELHPAVYRVIVGCVLFWVAASAAFFAGGSGYGGVVVGVVSAFAAICLLITNRMGAIQRAHPQPGRPPAPHRALEDWLSADFEFRHGHMRGWEAAVTLLTPIMAGVVGATAFVVVFHAVRPH